MQFTQQDSTNLTQQTALTRLGEIPLYSLDSLVRRSEPLQEAQILMEGDINAVRLHSETAKKLGLKEGDTARVKQDAAVAKLTVRIDERLAPNTVWIAGGIQATETLGDLMGVVEVSPC